MPDLLVTPFAQQLLACLCAELEDTVGGEPCMCCLVPGPVPVMDGCCACADGSGQATVVVTRVYPSTSTTFPKEGVDTRRGPCGTGYVWAAELAMYVYRCVHTVSSDNAGNVTVPTCPELDSDARMILEDAAAMRRALSCCDWHGNVRIAPGVWRPVQPQGGCAGGYLTVAVELGPECCPEPG